jgi:hypothetical protein
MFSLAEGCNYDIPRTLSAMTEQALSPSCHLLPTPLSHVPIARLAIHQAGNTPGWQYTRHVSFWQFGSELPPPLVVPFRPGPAASKLNGNPARLLLMSKVLPE